MMNQDNARTAARTRRMAFMPPQSNAPEQSVTVLPIGTHIGEFEIIDLIGEGGFGIVYLAYDHSLERQVALKEYMPSGLATRTTKMAVTVRSQHNADTFTVGLKSFINEAKMLAKFDSPALVKVHSFWEGNGTAYMVMPYYEGVTLKQALKQQKIKPSEAWIRLLLADLFDAIEIIHREHCLHRDIAPDNILLLKDGRPLLLDFGAARRVIGDLTQCLTAILKPGFAPIEQYADIAGLRQGAWTDIYALAAVVYYLITGKAPPPAVARMVHDEMIPAREAGKGRYSNVFLGVLDKALSVKPEQRFQSIGEIRRALDIMETVPRTLPRSASNWSTTVARTVPLADAKPEPKPHIKPEAKADIKPEAKADIKPEAKLDIKPDVKPEIKPEVAPERKPAERNPDMGTVAATGIKQEKVEPYIKAGPRAGITPERRESPSADMHAATQMAGSWQMPPEHLKPVPDKAGHDKLGWVVLGLLCTVGIASGVYVGTNRSWQGLSGQAVSSIAGNVAQQPPALPGSDGASGSEGTSNDTGASGSGELAAPRPSSRADTTSAPRAAQPPAAAPGETHAAATPQPNRAGIAQRKSPSGQPLSEIELWQMASTLDKPSGYERYLAEHPKGHYAAIARLRLERMQAQTARPAAPENAYAAPAPSVTPKAMPPVAAPRTNAVSAEEESWIRASTIHNAPAYHAYLREYPKGRYAALANDRLASMKQAETVISGLSKPTVQPAPQVALPEERQAPEDSGKQASSKPVEPEVAARTTNTPDTPPKPAAALPPAAAGSQVLTLKDQTMTGNFSVDPKTGLVTGRVRIQWNSGNQFDGTLAQGSKEGKGKFIWNNGQQYHGDWENDTPNGKGKFIFADGSRYEGDVRNGQPHGHGIYRFKGGNVYKGEWVRGKSHGHGRYTWANGSYWEGEFAHDKRTENGTMHVPDKVMRASVNPPQENPAAQSAGAESGAEEAAEE